MNAREATGMQDGQGSVAAPQSPVELFLQLKNSVSPAFSVVAGVQLDLFSVLEDGAGTVDEIAAALDVAVTKLRALLYVLVDAGFLEVDAERFSNAPVARTFLVRGSPRYAGAAIGTLPDWWRPILLTAESIRTGVACAKVDYANASAEELERHYQSFYLQSLATGQALAARYDFTACQNLLDVGGGTGGVTIAIATANPHLRSTVVDFPAVVSTCQRFVDAADVAERIAIVGADATHEPLGGPYDVAVMSAFMPVLGPELIRSVLANVARSVIPGGTLYVADGGMLDDSRLGPPLALHTNLNFINYFDHGESHTVGDRRRWLAQAGFEIVRRDVLPNQWGVLVARKRA